MSGILSAFAGWLALFIVFLAIILWILMLVVHWLTGEDLFELLTKIWEETHS